MTYLTCRRTCSPPSSFFCQMSCAGRPYHSSGPLENLRSDLGSTEVRWTNFPLSGQHHHHYTQWSPQDIYCYSSLNQDVLDKGKDPKVSTTGRTSHSHLTGYLGQQCTFLQTLGAPSMSCTLWDKELWKSLVSQIFKLNQDHTCLYIHKSHNKRPHQDTPIPVIPIQTLLTVTKALILFLKIQGWALEQGIQWNFHLPTGHRLQAS